MKIQLTFILSILILALLIVSPTASAITWIYGGYQDSTSTFFNIVPDSGDDDDDSIECKDINDEQARLDNLERDKHQTTYSDWSCINNKLQRTVTKYGNTEIQYGQACGFELDATETPQLSSAYILALILLILIIITVLLIVGVAAYR